MDNYTLPGGQIPKNKLGATTLDEYLELEGEEVAARNAELRDDPPDFLSQPLNSSVLKSIHGYLFQDVFEWAGHTRDMPFQMSDGTVAVAHRLKKPDGDYFVPGHLVRLSLNQFDRSLEGSNYLKGLTRQDFARQAADLLIELNNIHPFREGNGRTQRAFFKVLGQQAGHEIDFTVISGERMIQASIAGYNGNREPMRRLMDDATDPLRIKELQEVRGFLMAHNPSGKAENWSSYYLTTAHPGQTYSGVIGGISKNGVNFLLRDDGKRIVVGRTADLASDIEQGKRVQFTIADTSEIGPFSGTTKPEETIEHAKRLMNTSSPPPINDRGTQRSPTNRGPGFERNDD